MSIEDKETIEKDETVEIRNININNPNDNGCLDGILLRYEEYDY